MEDWIKIKVEQTRFATLSRLQDNVERTATSSQERIYATSALRIAREEFDELTQQLSTAVASEDKMGDSQLPAMIKMNQSLRAKLKEVTKICQEVYTAIIGPLPLSLRNGDIIFSELRDEVSRLREDLFVAQHGKSGDADSEDRESTPSENTGSPSSEIRDSDFSLRDFLELADFKMSHAAKQIFDLETRKYSEYSGSAIDWELRLKEVTQDLQKQVRRLTRSLQAEKMALTIATRQMRDEHASHVLQLERRTEELVQRVNSDKDHMKTSLESRITTLRTEQEDRLRDLQLVFFQKLGDNALLSEEIKLQALKALQNAVTVIKAKMRQDDGEVVAVKPKPIVLVEELIDVHQPWEGADRETLLKLLRGKINELEIQTSSTHNLIRTKTMEWESSLREIVLRYEDELHRVSDKAIVTEEMLQVSQKAVEQKVIELTDLKWNHALYREEVKTYSQNTNDAHQAKVAGLNSEIIDYLNRIQKLDETVTSQVEATQKLDVAMFQMQEKLKENAKMLSVSPKPTAEIALQTDPVSSGESAPKVKDSRKMSLANKYLMRNAASKELKDGSDSMEDEVIAQPSLKTFLSAKKSLARMKEGHSRVNFTGEGSPLGSPAKGGAGAGSGPNQAEGATGQFSPVGRPRRDTVRKIQIEDEPTVLEDATLSTSLSRLNSSMSCRPRKQSVFASMMDGRRQSMSVKLDESEASKLGIPMDQLARLLAPDPKDAAVLLLPRGPVDGSDPFPMPTKDDNMNRCINDTAFFRILTKMIVFQEFASAPQHQHTLSPHIKRLLLIRPQLQVHAVRDIRPVEALDLTCLNQYLEEHVAQLLMSDTGVMHPDDSTAVLHVSKITQTLINLKVERCVQAVSTKLLAGYEPGENSVDDNGNVCTSKSRQFMRPADLKDIIPLALEIMDYMSKREDPKKAKKIFEQSFKNRTQQRAEVSGGGSHQPAPETSHIAPRKPTLTVTNFVLGKHRRRLSHHISQLVDAAAILSTASELHNEGHEKVRRQSVVDVALRGAEDP